MVTCSTLLHLSLSRPKFRYHPYMSVNDFAFFVGTRVDKETNQLSLILLLQLEYGVVSSSMLLHLSLFCLNFANEWTKGYSNVFEPVEMV